MNQATADFIRDNADADVRQLALRGAKVLEVDVPFALDQIAGRQTARRKLPSWAAVDGIVYPPHLSMEQCSSEQTAKYKGRVLAGYVTDSSRFVDLTGGFGVDFAFIAQALSAVLSGLYVLKYYRSILPHKNDFCVAKNVLLNLLSSGLASALMLCVVDTGSVIFQRANNLLGESIITAQTAARRWISITMKPLGTIATASSTFIGQNWGAGKIERIKSALKQSIIIEILLSVFSFVITFIFGNLLVRFITGTSDTEIISNAVMSIRLHTAFYPALGVLFVLRTGMRSMDKKAAPVISSCIELALKLLSASWFIPKYGFLGTSMTEPVIWIFMMLFLIIAYAYQQKS